MYKATVHLSDAIDEARQRIDEAREAYHDLLREVVEMAENLDVQIEIGQTAK